MIKSMTGFASLTHEDDRATIGVTVRAVNHRFLDLQLRIPQSLGEAEPRVRALLQKRLSRGRVELQISLQLRTPAAPSVDLNEDFVNALSAAIDRARARGLVAGALTPGDLLRLPQAISVRDRAAEPDPQAEAQLATSVEAAVEQALADLDAMRVREGGHLRTDLDGRKDSLDAFITRVAAAAGGRKLDFLLQEMNREVNTIGSKADGLRVSELIINAKAELEKMREQVQNIE